MMPRGARRVSVRWWLFSAISLNWACCTTWKNQKPHGEQDEGDGNRHPQHGEAVGEPAPIFGNCHNGNYRFKNRPARRLSTKPGNHSIIWNATTPTNPLPNAWPTTAG